MSKVHIKKKICLLGSYGVGKTSLVRRFIYNKFEEKYLSTIGVHISKKILTLSSRKGEMFIELFIWDISNIEKFDSVVNSYLRGSHGAIIVTDITRPNTIENTDELANKFMELNPNAETVFVGNKYDLANETNFDKSKFKTNFDSSTNEFFLTSAKTGENIENVFNRLCEKLVGDN